MKEARNKIIIFIKAHEGHISAIALIVGFVTDNLTLPRVDSVGSQLVLAGYLLVAAFFIVMLQLIEAKRVSHRWVVEKSFIFPAAVQFLFGGLISAVFVYYSRSASILGSWPFMLLLLIMLIGNELTRDRYARLWFQLSVFFFLLFMGVSFALPVLVGAIGWVIFVASGLISLLIMFAFVPTLFLVVPITKDKFNIGGLIIGIFFLINGFYFLHFIPPIPLSLRSTVVAHNIVREEGGYRVLREVGSLRVFWRPLVIHVAPDTSLFFFSAIFAPTKLDTEIIHVWEFYNPRTRTWEERGVISFPIQGGREEGYRGYSEKTNLEAGKWRVSVRTGDGAFLGRTPFTVEITDIMPATEEVLL